MKTLPLLLAALALVAGVVVAPAPSPALAGDDTIAAPQAANVLAMEREVRALRDEINLWNLVNGLHLTPKQLVVIVRAAKEAREARCEACPTESVESLAAAAKLLESARDRLLAGASADADAAEDALRRAEALLARRRGPAKDPAVVGRKILGLEDRVAATLLTSQKEVMRTYKACLIPPQDLKDPVRVGQASDTSAYARLLDRALEIPASAWPVAGTLLVEAALAAEQHHNGNYAPDVLEKRRATIRGVLEEARALPAADRLLQKDTLAERIAAEDRPARLLEELGMLSEGRRHPGKIAHFLLDEKIVPLLEQRFAQLSQAERAPIDLDAVDPAETCEEGHCGTDRSRPGAKGSP